MYLILMMGASFGTGPITSEANVALWHNPDLQRPLGLGRLTGALSTFGAECRFTVAFQTQRQALLKVAV